MLSKIHNLYPEAILNPYQNQINLDDYFILLDKENTLAIPNSQLSQQEKKLLTHLFHPQTQSLHLQGNQNWYRFLFGQTIQPPSSVRHLRFLYFQIKSRETEVQTNLWMSTLTDAFSPILAWFQISPFLYCVIINASDVTPSLIKTLEGIVQSLDSDFDTSTRFIVGLLHLLEDHLSHHFQEELDLVQVKMERLTSSSTHLSSLLLKEFRLGDESNITLLNTLKDILHQNPDYRSVVETLFDTYGNLSQTADKLYIHRNTLSYRIQKFHKETGFDLHSLPDLVLCFLALK